MSLTAADGAARGIRHSPPARQTATAAAPLALTQGGAVRREVRGGERQTLIVTLAAGQYAQVAFGWRGIDLDAALFKPDGGAADVSLVQIRAGGLTPVSIIAGAAGEYRFEVSTRDGLKLNGAYEVQLRALRTPTAADESRVMAERALVEGKRPGSETAEAKLKEALQHWREAADPEGEARALRALAEFYQLKGGRDGFEKAKTNYEAAREIERTLNDPSAEGHTLLSLGVACQGLSSPEEALQYYERALPLFRGAGDRTGESLGLYDTGYALARAGKVRQAVKPYEEALSIQSADGDRLGEARTLTALGGAYDLLGDYDRALTFYQKAAPIRLEIGDRLGGALVVNNIAILHDNWGAWQKAKEGYETALDSYAALLNGGLDDCAAAASETARRICGYAASALDNLGELYNSLGDPQAALRTFEKSLPIRDRLNRPKGQGSTRSRMCYSNLLLGRPREALGWCEGEPGKRGALSFLAPADGQKPSVDPPSLAITYLFMGMAYDALDEREKAFEYFGRASEIQRGLEDPRALAITLDRAGAAYARAGDTKAALNRFDEALQLWRRVKDRDGEALTLYKIARAELDGGRLAEAHARIGEALDIVESLRVKVTAQRLRASYFAQKADYYELAVDVMMQLAKAGGAGVAPPKELAASALQTSERARARVLFDILAEARVEPRGGPDAALDELRRRRQELQQRLDQKAALQTRLLAAKAAPAELASVEKDLLRLTEEYDDVEARVRARSPRYEGLTRPQPLSAAEIQSQLLDEQTVLLEYALGERRSYLWVVARSGIEWFELPGRGEVEAAARRVRDILRDEQKRPGELEQPYRARLAELGGRFSEEAGRLSRMLLGPAASELGRKRLLVVAGGELQQVPFAALPAPGEAAGGRPRMLKTSATSREDGETPLGEEHEIVSLPSASTLAALRVMAQKRPRPPKAVAVLADPVFDQHDSRLKEALGRESHQAAPPPAPQALGEAVRSFGTDLPRLISSRREANAIVAAAPAGAATAALDFAANRTRATAADLGRYRIVHFATHAVFNDRHPELSGVVLSLFDQTG
ncbi:MAG TPA: tetratricopeptide repeat protein, partial [Pyrinomonadaceae bacterium]